MCFSSQLCRFHQSLHVPWKGKERLIPFFPALDGCKSDCQDLTAKQNRDLFCSFFFILAMILCTGLKHLWENVGFLTEPVNAASCSGLACLSQLLRPGLPGSVWQGGLLWPVVPHGAGATSETSIQQPHFELY